jgi:hypothetical protein
MVKLIDSNGAVDGLDVNPALPAIGCGTGQPVVPRNRSATVAVSPEATAMFNRARTMCKNRM